MPEHALRQAGGAARVPEQEVVAGPLDPRARVVRRRSGRRSRSRPAPPTLAPPSSISIEQRSFGRSVAHGRHPVAERAVVHEHLGVGVLEQRGELTGPYRKFTLAGTRAQLRAGEQAPRCTRGSCRGTARRGCRRRRPIGRAPRRRRAARSSNSRHVTSPLDPGRRRARRAMASATRLPDGREALVHGGDLRTRPTSVRGASVSVSSRHAEQAFTRHRASTRARGRRIAPHQASAADRGTRAAGPLNSVLLETP